MSYSLPLEEASRTPAPTRRPLRVLGAVVAAFTVTCLIQWFSLSNVPSMVQAPGEESGSIILMLVGFLGHILLIPILFGVFARWSRVGPALSSTLLGLPVFWLLLWLLPGLAHTARYSWETDLFLLGRVGPLGIHLMAALLSFGVLALVLREERKNTGHHGTASDTMHGCY